jgi:hypothetical protein
MEKHEHSTFENTRNLTRKIVDYLFENAENLWKLLYYTDTQPTFKPDLTTSQKASMICKDYSIPSDSVTKNVLFLTEIDEAFSASVPQLRIEVGDIYPYQAFNSAVQVCFQIIVPNKMKIISTEYSDVDDRCLAIFAELSKALNGKYIPQTGSKGEIFMNMGAAYGRQTGASRERNNKNYSGYWVNMIVPF